MKKILEQVILIVLSVAGGWGALWAMSCVIHDQWVHLLTAALIILLGVAAYEGWQRARNLERDK